MKRNNNGVDDDEYAGERDDKKRRKHLDPDTFGQNNSSRDGSSDGSSDGYDDTVGHIDFQEGQTFLERYVVEKQLGQGTFGKVFQCCDLKYHDVVAIKIIRKIEKYVESAQIESDILDDIYTKQKRKVDQFCVNLYATFHFDGRYFMVFEPLGISLLDLLQKNNSEGLPSKYVWLIAKQVLQALQFLSSMNLIHTDLKLENILFRSSDLVQTSHYSRKLNKSVNVHVPKNPTVKIIDFGGATYDDDRSKSVIINTRQYRSPEVILEAGWSFPSDMWSAACIFAELSSGDLLFATHNDDEHLALMERVVGLFPVEFVRSCPKKLQHKFFNDSCYVRWDNLSNSNLKYVRNHLSLEDIFSWKSSQFVRLLRRMLYLDPFQRYTASEALRSSYFDQ